MSLLQGIKRVVCGLSGGVDSAIGALLLKKKGYEVIGCFMVNWDQKDETGKCSIDEDYDDACFLAKKLEIPIFQANFVKEYWNHIFTEFISDYEHGLTPNPDILCNKFIKFDSFLKHAQEKLNAEWIATGHYAQIRRKWESKGEEVHLLQSADDIKDQTFFLSQVSQKALRQVLFPVGALTKPQVKQMALDNDLEKFAKRRESMGICFIGNRKFKRFIDEYIEPREGSLIDVESRQVLGSHRGIHHYTIGQRVAVNNEQQHRGPFYVVSKEARNQIIYVAHGHEHPSLYAESLITAGPHWISSSPGGLDRGDQVECSFRFQHMHKLIRCRLQTQNDGLKVTLAQPLRAIAPGQFAVFYQDDECLGSARIVQVGLSLMQQNCDRPIVDSDKVLYKYSRY